jgi:hypothetical protein
MLSSAATRGRIGRALICLSLPSYTDEDAFDCFKAREASKDRRHLSIRRPLSGWTQMSGAPAEVLGLPLFQAKARVPAGIVSV